MKHVRTSSKRSKFKVIAMTRGLEAAMMSLRGGESSDEQVTNEHPKSEQWLYVISGSGTAIVVSKTGSRRSIKLRAQSLLTIEKGERHQIRNTGKKLLRTINFYAPPAYSRNGELKRSAKKR